MTEQLVQSLMAEADELDRQAKAKRVAAQEICTHPNEKIESLGYEINIADGRDSVANMRCPDCGKRWSKPN